MSAEVKILIEGCTNADSVAETGEEKIRPTITLVKDDDIVMVVDPGILEDQQILIDALAKEHLSINDVNVVCITHSHIDHYRNIGMFPKAKTLEFYGLWDKDTVKDWREQFSSNIQILRTPGHDRTGITIFVTTDSGAVAICGDVFWKENYPEDPHDDKYASDIKQLEESRTSILKMADWIIPGHAGMYKNERAEEASLAELRKMTKDKEVKFSNCRKCKRPIIRQQDACICQSWLCYRCCECDMECDLCGCHNKNKR